MATKGLKYPVYARYADDGGVVSYSGGKVAGKSISVSAKYQRANVKLFADDGLADADQTVIGGTLTLNIFGLQLLTRAEMLGHTASAEGVGFVGATTDEAPYFGFGFYGAMSGGRWRAFWYQKIQFAEPDDELETKGERTAFKTPTLSGEIALDINGEWGEIREFDSEAGAVAWLNANTGILPQCKTPDASVPSGTYATEQTVTLTAGDGEEIYYTTNGTTPSKTNGTKYVSAVSIAATSALRAISTAAGKTDSAVANYEYIITG